MSKGLDYFKQVYDVVPGWVQKMHDYNPIILDHYTNLRGEIMKADYLSAKQKDIFLVGMNAARLYARSMVYHTKGSIDGGATLPELVEYLLVSYLYNGAKSLKTGLQSIEYALSLKGLEVKEHFEGNDTAEEILMHIIKLLGDEDTTFVKDVLQLVQSGDEAALQEKLLSDGIVSKKLKYILMVGIYVTALNGQKAGKWMELARENGASEGELADVGYICLLTAGIPAWFEASDSLIEK